VSSKTKNTNSNNDGQVLSREFFWRIIFVFSILFVGFLALIARLVVLQIVDTDKYKSIAHSQHESRVSIRAERGDIYDRNGKLLASTIKSISFAIDPSILKDSTEIGRICERISIITGQDIDKLLSKVNNSKGSFVWLARGILPFEAQGLDSIRSKGFIKVYEPKRVYLYGSLASQVIGCTDIDNNGLTGLELALDSLLKGHSGSTIMLRNAARRLIPTLSTASSEASNGKSVKLTIDIELQRIAEHELRLGVEKSGSEAGSIVILDPTTGEILAMASFPTFDPNNIMEILSGAMKNRVISDVYEPGSTFKLITAAAALEENVITPDEWVDGCNGLLKFPDYEIKDDHALGKVRFPEAVEKSSNIVFSTIANNIPSNKFYKYIRDFGFGLEYNLELYGEESGRIKPASKFDAVSKRFMGFGYGIMVTPLQMANAYAVVANFGEMMKPYIISNIYNSNNEVITTYKPIRIRRVLSQGTSKALINLLVGVVERGTGTAAKIEGLRIAGKTGTAQQVSSGSYSKANYTASFAGILPADNPKFVMMIVLDKPQGNIYGGSTAAPIFRNISKSWITINHDFLNEKHKISNSLDTNRFITLPNLKGMSATVAIRLLTNLGLKCQNPENISIIGNQQPKQGAIVRAGSEVLILSASKSLTLTQESLLSEVNGLNIKNALAILQNKKIAVSIEGSGLVQNLYLSKSGDKINCRLICK
jgi:cell division protein FtsI/penicillin-binding protein 2